MNKFEKLIFLYFFALQEDIIECLNSGCHKF